jgi:hypothetical protein
MFRDEKNLKDSIKDSIPDVGLPQSGIPTSGTVSYTKTQKLITALYMVTDIIDKDEPIRNKLRTLGVEILSDTHLIKQNNVGHPMSFINSKISELLSFLAIASDLNIISQMNCSILKKEFSELDQSIKDSVGNTEVLNKRINLVEFFANSNEKELDPYPASPLLRGRSKEGVFAQLNSKGHLPARAGTSLGVQKGSTLLKALRGVNVPARPIGGSDRSFDILKKQRRDNIINIIRIIGGGATIKDIKDKAKVNPSQAGSLVSCGEKTLQRELFSMVRDGVLYKTGEKRWSRYFIK